MIIHSTVMRQAIEKDCITVDSTFCIRTRLIKGGGYMSYEEETASLSTARSASAQA
jgi:hypothetical protein